MFVLPCQRTLPSTQTSLVLQPLLADTLYKMAVTPVYPDGDGATVAASGRTRMLVAVPTGVGENEGADSPWPVIQRALSLSLSLSLFLALSINCAVYLSISASSLSHPPAVFLPSPIFFLSFFANLTFLSLSPIFSLSLSLFSALSFFLGLTPSVRPILFPSQFHGCLRGICAFRRNGTTASGSAGTCPVLPRRASAWCTSRCRVSGSGRRRRHWRR